MGMFRKRPKGSTIKERILYAFDTYMSHGVISLIVMLFLASALIIAIVGLVCAFIGGANGEGVSFGEASWSGLMHVLSTGALSKDTGSVLYVFLMLLVTLTGMFITSALIALINQGIRARIDRLRKGRSLVLEEGHIVILGFNESVLGIIEELALAGKDTNIPAIVVMANHDKVDMEDRIAQRVSNRPGIKIVCRTGNLDHPEDIQICSLGTCKSVIIELQNDFMTIKALLACVHLLKQTENAGAYITAVIHQEDNVRPAQIAGGKRAEIVFSKKMVSRLMVQSALQPGMSKVFVELLSFAGNDLNLSTIEQAAGQTLSAINNSLVYGTAIGVVSDGIPKVNPPADYNIGSSDRLILISRRYSETDRNLVPRNGTPLEHDTWADMQEPWVSPRRMLVLGNDELLPLIIRDADAHSPQGSNMVIATAPGEIAGGMPEPSSLQNITYEIKECNIFEKGVLEDLMQLRPQSVIILANRSIPTEESDAQALMLQLRLHDIASQGSSMFAVAIEMRDAKNQGLAQVSYMTDFVTSDKVNALIMTQIADERHKRAVLADLLDKDGSAIYMKPALRYVKRDTEVDFYNVSASVARFDEIAIGYRKHTKGGRYSIVLTPVKTEKTTFTSEDSIIVISRSWK